MITVDAAKALAKRTLSPRRDEHTLNVRRLAVRPVCGVWSRDYQG